MKIIIIEITNQSKTEYVMNNLLSILGRLGIGYSMKVKEDDNKAIQTLKNVLHHNDGTKDEFKLPKSLVNEIENSIKNV